MYFKNLIFTLILALCLLPCNVAYSREKFKDYKVVSVYVFNFLKYTKWPTENQRVICISNDNNVKNILEAISTKYKFTLKNIADNEAIDGCSIVFIGNNSEHLMANIIEAAKQHHVLTISTIPNFIHNGGLVGLTYKGDNIELEINLKAALQNELVIDAEVIELASNVIR